MNTKKQRFVAGITIVVANSFSNKSTQKHGWNWTKTGLKKEMCLTMLSLN